VGAHEHSQRQLVVGDHGIERRPQEYNGSPQLGQLNSNGNHQGELPWTWVTVDPQQVHIPQRRLHAVQDESSDAAIRETYRKFGFLSEPGIYKGPHGYTLVYGQRRLEEAIRQGVKQVTVKLWTVGDADAILLEFAENYARGSINVVNLAERIQDLMNTGKYRAKDLARILNMSEQTVSKVRMVLDLPPSVKKYLASRRLSLEHAVELHRIRDKELQARVARMIVEQGWTSAQLRNYVNHGLLKRCDNCNKPLTQPHRLYGKWLCSLCLEKFYPEEWKNVGLQEASLMKVSGREPTEQISQAESKCEHTHLCEICKKRCARSETTQVDICNEDLNKLRSLTRRLFTQTGKGLHELDSRQIANLSINIKRGKPTNDNV